MLVKFGEIDEALAKWRQGDVVLGEQRFVYLAVPARALTPESGQIGSKEEIQAITKKEEGLVVVTQSCDIVRSCNKRPFIEVAALVRVEEEILVQVKNLRRPQYAYIPAIADRLLVADLDRVMTVEKSVVASWERIQGCTTSDEVREFAEALARKRGRFAFPDDFVKLIEGLHAHIRRRHKKDSEEGMLLRELQEIRIQVEPEWKADEINLRFLLIRKVNSNFSDEKWHRFRERYLEMAPPQGRFRGIDALVTSLGDLKAREYIESDRLDLDYLSANE